MTNLNVETNELSMNELEAVSGGAPGLIAQTLSVGCEALGNFAAALGATVAAYHLYTAAGELIH